MTYTQKYELGISLSLPLLERILLIEPIRLGIDSSFEDPRVDHWRYRLIIGKWESSLLRKPDFTVPCELKFEKMSLYIHDSDSNSAIGMVFFE